MAPGGPPSTAWRPGSVTQDPRPGVHTVEAVRALARAARLLERASSEISMAHYRVLSAVAGGEERASRVAERLELGRPAISSAVESLCRGGLLVRDGTEGDQRAFDLRVTPAGAALLDRVEGAMTACLDDLCARNADGPRVQEALALLGGAIDQRDAERARRHRDHHR